MSGRRFLARLAAPAAFLLAVTVLVLLVRSATSADEEAATTGPTATAPAETVTAPVTTEETETDAEPEPPPATTPAGNTYTIQAGDTFETIAEQHGTTVEQLVELNPDVDPTALQIGQTIRVP